MKQKFSAIVAMVLMVVGVFVASPSTASAAVTPEQSHTDHIEAIAEMFDRHNEARIANGSGPLVYSPYLAIRFAQNYSQKLASTEGPLKHQDMGPLLYGVPGATMVGENIYAGGGSYANPEQAVYHLMKSPTHRENMLDKGYTTMAVGWDVSEEGSVFATVHFWAGSLQIGDTYTNGTELIEGIRNPKPSQPEKTVDIYTTEGYHEVNGRHWWTTCEPYSQIERCRTEIWATQVIQENGQYLNKQDWVFNNLTYTPAARSLWKDNPLGGNGVVNGKIAWVAEDGRRWRTECDTALTGRNGCRSFIIATVIEKQAGRYITRNKEVFNNMVRFK